MKKRIIGLDILKILCMIMILFMHFTGRETLNSDYAPSQTNFLIVKFIDCLCCVAVNCYFLITGYFLVDKEELKLNKIFNIWRVVLSYTIAILGLNILLENKNMITYKTIIVSIFPIITRHYWFITAYIAMLFLAPLIAKFLTNITKKQYQYLLTFLTIILVLIGNIWPINSVFNELTGINFITMFYVYIIGGYIKLYKDKNNIKKEKYLLGYFIFSIITFIYSLLTNLLDNQDILYAGYLRKDLAYNSIWVVISSIMLFMYCKEINMKNNTLQKLVVGIQPLTLATYIIHENIFFKLTTLKMTKYQNSWKYMTAIFIGIITIYIGCCIIEYIRRKVCQVVFKNKVINKFEVKIEEKLNNILDSEE